ncbi:MAG TPA: hypothetical protein VHC22_19990 [Pirellulales bacterium]|nr:hypothetical protein [Pirellulales bacterium]
MQSSPMVALRTMIMIVCLVAVPLAAVFGTALSAAVKSACGIRDTNQSWSPPVVVEEEPPARAGTHALAADNAAPAAEAPKPETIGPALPILPRARITGVRAVADAAPPGVPEAAEPVIETAPLWNPAPRTASTSHERQTTTHFVPSSPPQHRPHPLAFAARQPATRGDDSDIMVLRRRPDRRGEALQKTAYSPPDDADLSAQADDQLEPVDRTAPVDSLADNPLAESERRLRDMGATYCRLEAWGADGKFYRCSCNIPMSPRGRATRHFEAIESAPSQAIDAVIRQVEAWRSR